MRIAFFEVHDWEIPPLQSPLADHQTSFHPGKVQEANLAEFSDAEVLSVFIFSRIDALVLECLPRLRLIATRSTGYDHVDLPACRARSVAVANVPNYGENTVAEHTFA